MYVNMYSVFEVVNIDTTPAPSRFIRKIVRTFPTQSVSLVRKLLYYYSNHLTYQIVQYTMFNTNL